MIDPETGYYVRAMEAHRAVWEGIELEICYERDFLGMGRAHLEIRSINPSNAPLPVTPTGYQSAFPDPQTVEDVGGPVAYVLDELDAAAKSHGWHEQIRVQRQLSLF